MPTLETNKEITVRAVYASLVSPPKAGTVPTKRSGEPTPKKTKNNLIRRRRMNTRPVGCDIRSSKNETEEKKCCGNIENANYETATFVPTHGLVGSFFFHADIADHPAITPEEPPYPQYDLDKNHRVYEERAILFQSIEHYQELSTDPHTSSYFHMKDPELPQSEQSSNTSSENDADLPDTRFGEQILVEGCNASQICIGDVFAFVDPMATANETADNDHGVGLVVEVTSPRLACADIDTKCGSPFGCKGLRRHVNTNGLAGWFARVLKAGDVRDGMTLVRIARPHPQWTLANTAKALYGECYDNQYHNLCWAQWNRSKQELEELCALEAFGWHEWKEEAQWLLDRWDLTQVWRKEKEAKASSASVAKPPSMRAMSKPSLTALSSNVYRATWMLVAILPLIQNWTNVMTYYIKATTSPAASSLILAQEIPDNNTFYDALVDL